MKISEIDRNFKVETNIQREGLTFFNISDAPFSVHGVFREGDAWVRLPKSVAENVSPGVLSLSSYTAGGRVRFVTDSPYIAIKVIQPKVNYMAHMAISGQAGFDLYIGAGVDPLYLKTFIPPNIVSGGFEGVIDLPSKKKNVVTLNFPLYYGVNELYIGLDRNAILAPPPEYTVKKPIVFYGSSITQGGCASRPGTSYQGFISRSLDADYINLGFSGNARGETAMADYIAGLDMSAFVLDYDHNAPSDEHLEETHEPFFKRIRLAHPDIPIIVMSRPRANLSLTDRRAQIIKRTVDNAKSAGDNNVYHIHGAELMQFCGNEGTVDGTHPTDFGFYSMAKRVLEDLKKIL